METRTCLKQSEENKGTFILMAQTKGDEVMSSQASQTPAYPTLNKHRGFQL